MKTLLFAAGLLLVPAAAQAQVAAATVPNTFDRPAQAAPARPAPATPAVAAPAVSTVPANARSGEVLREIIADGQAGALDYSLMSDDLAAQVRQQEAAIVPLLQGFGVVQAVDFVGSQAGADLYVVTFTNAATQWMIGFNEADKVAALLFRPAQ